mmetsp:Transcript_3224/g.9266  ORF Transcript_3224/g.9266 Transcript_3224/m.9266 type:complete len:301 (-) Transcript_3224:152-1054(-)
MSPPSNSREAITETADSNTNSGNVVGVDNSTDAPPDDEAVAVDQQASWFGMGGLGSAALSLAQGVASAIHQTAVNVAEELAEMERLAGQEAEEEEARRHDRDEKDLCITTKRSGRASTGTTTSTLPLPWQVPRTTNGKGSHESSNERSNDDVNSLLVEDKGLKEKILALAQTPSTFEGPFTVENTNTILINDDDQESYTYFTKDRVELVERLLGIDKHLAKAHSVLTFGATNQKAEELFFRNYFFHCEEIRSNYTIRDEELDIDIVLQTPPPSPDQRGRPLISALSAPRQLSVDDLVLIG